MKRYAVLFMTMISLTISGADIDQKSKSAGHCFTSRELQKSSEIFWGLLNGYRRQKNLSKKADILSAMRKMLQNNLGILKKQGCINVGSYKRRILMYPLEWAVLAASDQGTSANSSLSFAEHVAQLDEDGHRRRSAMKIAIDRSFFGFVSYLLELGTDVTDAPGIMKKSVAACERFHNPDQRWTPQRIKLDRMLDELLTAGADVSALGEKRFSKGCRCCHRIKGKYSSWERKRREERERRRATYCPSTTPFSSSSSSSSSSCDVLGVYQPPYDMIGVEGVVPPQKFDAC